MSAATATLALELPIEVFSALRKTPEDFALELRLAAAIHWYSRGEMSMEKAATIAGLNRRDFILALADARVDVFAIDVDDFERELASG